jgi:exodeoxyribonuclease VII large subunit
VRIEFQRRIAASVISRRQEATLAAVSAGRRTVAARAGSLERARTGFEARQATALAAHAAALRGHDPERTLERGYALLVDASGEPLVSAAALREAEEFDARLADGTVRARVTTTREERP